MTKRFASNRQYIHGEIIVGYMTAAFGYSGTRPGTNLHMALDWFGMVDLAAVLMVSGLVMVAVAGIDLVVSKRDGLTCWRLANLRSYACLITAVVWTAIAVGGFSLPVLEPISALRVVPWAAVPYAFASFVANQSVVAAMSDDPTPNLELDRRRF